MERLKIDFIKTLSVKSIQTTFNEIEEGYSFILPDRSWLLGVDYPIILESERETFTEGKEGFKGDYLGNVEPKFERYNLMSWAMEQSSAFQADCVSRMSMDEMLTPAGEYAINRGKRMMAYLNALAKKYFFDSHAIETFQQADDMFQGFDRFMITEMMKNNGNTPRVIYVTQIQNF